MRPLLILLNICLAASLIFAANHKHNAASKLITPEPKARILEPINKPAEEIVAGPRLPAITDPTPTYKSYPNIILQLQEWNKEAPDFTEIGTHGKTSKGTDIYHIKVTNKFIKKEKKRILITACIHGNEPWSTGVIMAYIGNVLNDYKKNEQVTKLLDTYEIYFVPVVSPDSYPSSRHVDGVDPNRNFPGPNDPNKKSVPPVKAIQDLFLKIKPSAVISGHTHGRVFLTPYGDKNEVSPNEADFKRIVGKMGEMCSYRVQRACQMYGTPIFGSEVDWYYRNGAFPIVMEFGTHQIKPGKQEIIAEFERTYKAVLFFMEEAPRVDIKITVPTDLLLR